MCDQISDIEDSLFEDDFQEIANLMNDMKSKHAMLQKMLKSLEKKMNKEKRNFERLIRKKKARKKPSGFAMPCNLSDELCAFMNIDKGSQLPRTDVTKYVNNYIKKKELQDPNNRSIILCDDKLLKLLRINSDDKLTYFNLQKFMNIHYN